VSKFIDLTGKTFGKLTVTSMSEERGNRGVIQWNCRCSCGNHHLVTGGSLTSGNTTKCKCCRYALQVNDLTGQTFGKLTVADMAEGRSSDGGIQWVCKCACGNFRTVIGSELRRNSATCCSICARSSRINDLTGQTFGKLTVISMADGRDKWKQIQFNCVCSCGNALCVSGAYLRRTAYPVCPSCSKYIPGTTIVDLTGKVFGKLSVISVSSKRGNKRQVHWNCACSCGKHCTVMGARLRNGKTKSCGCVVQNNNREDAILRKQYSEIKYMQHKNGRANTISFELFKELIFKPCVYCGVVSSKELPDYGKNKKKISDTVLHVNGIDRIDSSKGYIECNVVTCCSRCNAAKQDISMREFREHIKKMYCGMFLRDANEAHSNA